MIDIIFHRPDPHWTLKMSRKRKKEAKETSVALYKPAGDPLEKEVAIVATLEENGLHVKAKSRTVAAFDRLLGNMIDFPSALFEPKLDRLRDEGQLQRELRKIEHDQILEVAKSPTMNDLYIKRYRREQMERDRNKLLIGFAAIDDLKRLPPPAHNGSEQDLDADWLSEYIDIAGRKSCHDIQKLWGRLLASEIRNPGSYNLRILQRLAAIDNAEANLINDFLLYSISNEFVLRDVSNAMPGINMNKLLEMQDLDVASVSGSNIVNNISLEKGSPFFLALSGDIIKLTAEENASFALPIFPLTSFGKALAALITFKETPDGYVNRIRSEIRLQHIRVETAKIISENDLGQGIIGDWKEI